MPKRIFIIAGPNGAGKTTFANSYLSKETAQIPFLNADNIAAEMCPDDPESVAIAAGRRLLELIAVQVTAGGSFVVETTLSGRTYARAIPRWRNQGYEVILFFLRLPDADTAVARVAERIRQGGHAIPPDTIRRRFAAGWRNFEDLYKPLVDAWAVYDSFQNPPRILERGSLQP